MILVVSLNPAVDKTCRTDRVCPGKVNRLRSAVSVAGGKGVNVAKVLRQFRLPVALTGFLGGSGGRLIGDAMEEAGVSCFFTDISGQTRTNVNVLAEDGSVTELLEPGPVISKKELEEFKRQFSGCLEMSSLVVLSGSVPEGVPADIYAELIGECRRRGIPVILDSSGEALRCGISAGPDWVKPNRKELEYLADGPLADTEAVQETAGKLCLAHGCRMVVTLGEEGLFLADGQQTYFQQAKKVKAVNTVGCGDTVVASLAMSCLEGEDAEIMLRKAAALAAANATTAENGQIPMQTYLELL